MGPEQKDGVMQNPIERYFDTMDISAQAKAIFKAGDGLINREINPNDKLDFLGYQEKANQLRNLVLANPEAWEELLTLGSYLDNYDDQGNDTDFFGQVVLPVGEVRDKIRSVLP